MPLSSKLGPRARTLASTATQKLVTSLVEIDHSADIRNVARQLRKAGAYIHGSPAANTTGFIRVEVPADHLNAVAAVSDVVYIEADRHRY
jgi:hypothetical protein